MYLMASRFLSFIASVNRVSSTARRRLIFFCLTAALAVLLSLAATASSTAIEISSLNMLNNCWVITRPLILWPLLPW